MVTLKEQHTSSWPGYITSLIHQVGINTLTTCMYSVVSIKWVTCGKSYSKAWTWQDRAGLPRDWQGWNSFQTSHPHPCVPVGVQVGCCLPKPEFYPNVSGTCSLFCLESAAVAFWVQIMLCTYGLAIAPWCPLCHYKCSHPKIPTVQGDIRTFKIRVICHQAIVSYSKLSTNTV
jgi:hypothetical protein